MEELRNLSNKELNGRLKQISINSRRIIIENIGLTKGSRELLIAKYIDEMSTYEMCDIFGYDEKYIINKIARAKQEMSRILAREYKFMSDDLKEYINLIIKD